MSTLSSTSTCSALRTASRRFDVTTSRKSDDAAESLRFLAYPATPSTYAEVRRPLELTMWLLEMPGRYVRPQDLRTLVRKVIVDAHCGGVMYPASLPACTKGVTRSAGSGATSPGPCLYQRISRVLIDGWMKIAIELAHVFK